MKNRKNNEKREFVTMIFRKALFGPKLNPMGFQPVLVGMIDPNRHGSDINSRFPKVLSFQPQKKKKIKRKKKREHVIVSPKPQENGLSTCFVGKDWPKWMQIRYQFKS